MSNIRDKVRGMKMTPQPKKRKRLSDESAKIMYLDHFNCLCRCHGRCMHCSKPDSNTNSI